jgi:hypothetical protein
VDGLQELLTEFLSFAKPPAMEMLPTDLNQLLQDDPFVAPGCDAGKSHIVIFRRALSCCADQASSAAA